jgi:FO synthase subunit 2
MLEAETDGLDKVISAISPAIAKVLTQSLEGKDISDDDAILLFKTSGRELNAVVTVADELRRQKVGNIVTYVVNRNINFTNVCIKRCGFCAFSRDHLQEEGYLLPIHEILRRSKEAWDLGATEVCIQAGLPPKMKGDFYIRLCETIKATLPNIHIHGFSPEEVLYGATRSKSTIREYLIELKNAGVGSLPGTSAEILDQKLRDYISPGRITVEQWTNVIITAHELGIPTTSTMMYGHVENDYHKVKHLSQIREIQKQTGGFSEFVPLGFINEEAPMFFNQTVPEVRPGATGVETLKVHAISRIMLNNWIRNIQVSWVKEGLKVSQMLLSAGVNDMGGSLINESISTSAGAQHGQLVKPSQFRSIIRDAGRIPAERYTTYEIKHVFDGDDERIDPLDAVEGNLEEIFGSYKRLLKTKSFQYRHPSHDFDQSKQAQ